MFKVIDVFPVGSKLSVTLEGACENISSGTIMVDNNGNLITIESVAMTRYENPSDISKSTTVLIAPCDICKGCELSIA